MAWCGGHLPGSTPPLPAIDFGDRIAPGTAGPATAQLWRSQLLRTALARRRPGRQSRAQASSEKGPGLSAAVTCLILRHSETVDTQRPACRTWQGLVRSYEGGDRGRELQSPSRCWSLHFRRKATALANLRTPSPNGGLSPRKPWAGSPHGHSTAMGVGCILFGKESCVDGCPFLLQRIQETSACSDKVPAPA